MVVPTPAALGCNTLYDLITTGDGVEAHTSGEEIVPEDYEEEYGTVFKFTALSLIHFKRKKKTYKQKRTY